MDIDFASIPQTESEYLILIARYKTVKDTIWPILHRWVKKYGPPNQSEEHRYYLQFMLYIRNN